MLDPIVSARPHHLTFGLALCLGLAVAAAEKRNVAEDFSAGAPSGWKTSGNISVDKAFGRSGADGALRVDPGGKAAWKLRNVDGSGRVEMWVYDDMTVASNPKARRVGPRWGVMQADGRVLAVGIIYAPYLSGATTYAVTDSDQKTTWFHVQYTAVRRSRGWHKWTFDFDPIKGATISHNGKRLPKRRFDWNKTKIQGFNAVAVFGDAGKADPHTMRIDDVNVALGGPMTVKPVPPPPPPPVVPAEDEPVSNPVHLIESARGKHPRLLFSPADVPAMKARALGSMKSAMAQVLGYLPACVPPRHTRYQTDATDAQRQGMWRAPTVALHYVLTGDKQSFQRARGFLETFLAQPHWETRGEQDCGMGAANIMVGAALVYDWLYNDLDPTFREKARRRLLLQARRMYYAGHLNRAKATGYWQGDPQNNHRFHRDAGLALCALAVAGDGPGDEWVLKKTFDELKFIHDWLPPDGSCHESPSYMVFGGPYLMLALQAADRCFGTHYLEHPFFRNAPLFRLHTLTPGFKDIFHYGDSGGVGFINNYFYKCCALHNLADAADGLRLFEAASPSAFHYGWTSLVWNDGTPTGGSVDNLPKAALFPDLGIAFVRDGWRETAIGAMFKCGPYGGRKLNEYRNRNHFHYINVAHDDPDANMFLIYAGGRLIAENDRYSKKKLTRSHNTILVNGRGQRGEGSGWTQPYKRGDKDMTKSAFITAWQEAGDVVVAQGEAGGAYAGLQSYRRTFIWVKGAYILVLDDIRADESVEITWLVQGPDLVEATGGSIPGCYRLQAGNDRARCDFQVVSAPPCSYRIGTSTADNRNKPLGFKKLQVKATGVRVRFASVFDPWHRGNLCVALQSFPDGRMQAKVTGPDLADAWTATPATVPRRISPVTGVLANGTEIRVGE